VRVVRLSLRGSVYDPTDPVGRSLLHVSAMVTEFEADLIGPSHPQTDEGCQGEGRLSGSSPNSTSVSKST